MKQQKKTEPIPEAVRACLWFADSDTIDWEAQQDLIITQILNRGTWEAVRWAHRHYGEEAIRQVVSHPKRGLWFPQVLQFWSLFFELSLKRETLVKALHCLDPA